MKSFLIGALAFVCTPFLFAETAPNKKPTGEVYTYKEVDGVAREIEIYFPEGHKASGQRRPGIILFHGGGWGGGTRQAFSDQCNYFASRGLVAATVTYRLVTKAERAKMKDERPRRAFAFLMRRVRSAGSSKMPKSWASIRNVLSREEVPRAVTSVSLRRRIPA